MVRINPTLGCLGLCYSVYAHGVSWAGVSTRAQVDRAVEAGAHAVLVGEALMRAKNPAAKLRQLRGELAPVAGLSAHDQEREG